MCESQQGGSSHIERASKASRGWKRHLGLAAWALIIASLVPAVSLAEVERRRRGEGLRRPSGFLLELEMGATSPTFASGLGGLSSLGGAWSFRPGLVIGGQIRRFGLGLLIGGRLSRRDSRLEAAGEPATSSSLTVGPSFDFEVWGTNLAAIFIKAAVPVYLGASDGGRSSAGFGVDAGVGGRVFFRRHFSIGIMLGVNTHFLWWDYEPEIGVDASGSDIGASLYGSIVMRFVGGGRSTRPRARGRSAR